ncbi:MAG: C25 family cysteine peptidase [Caldilineaceae bacterium]
MARRLWSWQPLAVVILMIVAIGIVPSAALHSHAGLLQGDQPQAPTAAADLVVTGITLTPPNPAAGGTADIEVNVKNQGDAAVTGGFNLYLYVEPTDTPPTQSTAYTIFAGYALTLPQGGSFKYTRTGQVFSSTPPRVYAWVDPPWENKVAESNEENNLYPPAVNGGDAYEDDDTCVTAKAIVPDGAAQDRNLYRNPDADVDWIKFDASSGVTYVVEATPVGPDASLVIEVIDRCDGLPTFGGGAKMEFTAPANGAIYVKISHVQATYGPANAYQFKVTSNSGCPNHFEPNDTCQLAGDLPLATDQAQTFCSSGDVDWMRIGVAGGAGYTIGAANVGAKADVELSLFKTCADANPAASGKSLSFTAAESASVYVKAEQKSGGVYGAGTEYTVRAELTKAGCSEDSYEQDDSAVQAKPIGTTGLIQTRNICPAGDEEWVKFGGVAGTTYNIETLNLAAAADTILCLHAANGDQIACDDDSGAGAGSRLIWTPPATGDYLLHVTDISSSAAGDETKYDLHILSGLCQKDGLEDDNSPDGAHVVAADNSVSAHNFCPGDDQDWAAFSAAGGTTYTIETLDPGPDADTVIELYDAAHNLLAQNDDHTPGTVSQVVYTPAKTLNVFVKVRQYNPSYFGAGTEYGLRIGAGMPTPTPTPTPAATPAPTPTPNASAVRTLILVNRARLVELNGESEVAPLMSKLEALAQNSQIRGEIIRLDNNTEVSAAYAVWTGDIINVDKANQLTSAIRNVVVSYLQQHGGIEYLILVGDDRVLPMRRIKDATPRVSESNYKNTDATNAIGAALKANYFLSDDYFSDREPTLYQGHEIFIPDLATGRLIETPAEMIGQIDAYMAQPVTIASNILVTGYDFVQDVATEGCADCTSDFGADSVNCTLIGDAWTGQSFRLLQLRTSAPFKLQSISGHATHYAEGAPVGDAIQASEIAAAALDLKGGLLFTPGCHAGLNVPPDNSKSPLDLPQAFAGKGANYIGNTGYGWGMRGGIGLSEKVLRLYTRALLQGTKGSMGKALATAKALYFQQDTDLSAYDEKVMQQVVYYGLPMYELESGAALMEPDNDFPGVAFKPSLPDKPLGGGAVMTGSVKIDFRQAQNLNLQETGEGDFFNLNGSMHTVPDQPIQPLHFGDVTAPGLPGRGVVLLGASFQTRKDFDPVVAAPYNEYDTSTDEPRLATTGLYPPLPVSLQQTSDRVNLVTQLGQYDAGRHELRLFQDVLADIYYSTDADNLAPQATVIAGITRVGSNRVDVKVGAVDASGIQRAVVSYIQDITQSVSELKSLDLSYDSTAQKWVGSFAGNTNSRYLVQVVDKAGNVTTATNKGQYYTPGQVKASANNGCGNYCAFLPVVKR